MSAKHLIMRALLVLSLTLTAATPGVAASGSGISGIAYRTNWVSRTITNTVEVTVPDNRFVNFYRTNHILQVFTNTVDVYLTNRVVEHVTNTYVVDVVRTNMRQAYLTNYHTLNLTNWNTVLLFRTNWINQPVTNVVNVELIKSPASPQAAAPAKQPVATPPPLLATMATDALSVQARKTGRALATKQIEVEFAVKPTRTGTALKVQQWRIESIDGSFLCCVQDPEFKRDLAPGSYKVEVKAQRDSRSPALAAKGTLALSANDLVLQLKTPRM